MEEKRFRSIQFCMEIYGKCWVVCENISFVKVSYEHVMVAWLKEIYELNTPASSIFFLGGAQAKILNTTYH